MLALVTIQSAVVRLEIIYVEVSLVNPVLKALTAPKELGLLSSVTTVTTLDSKLQSAVSVLKDFTAQVHYIYLYLVTQTNLHLKALHLARLLLLVLSPTKVNLLSVVEVNGVMEAQYKDNLLFVGLGINAMVAQQNHNAQQGNGP